MTAGLGRQILERLIDARSWSSALGKRATRYLARKKSDKEREKEKQKAAAAKRPQPKHAP